MSNVNKPIRVPPGVEVTVADARLRVKGALGELQRDLPPVLKLQYDPARQEVLLARLSEDRRARSLHGLYHTLVANMVEGVSKGYEKALEVHGTGYNVKLKGSILTIQVGFTHPVELEVPPGMRVEVLQSAAQPDNPAKFVLRGADKWQVGQFAANIRAVRPPEPYKGKGIRYAGEYVRRKEGKAFVGTER